MKAKLVRENIEFKRGIEPKESMGLGYQSVVPLEIAAKGKDAWYDFTSSLQGKEISCSGVGIMSFVNHDNKSDKYLEIDTIVREVISEWDDPKGYKSPNYGGKRSSYKSKPKKLYLRIYGENPKDQWTYGFEIDITKEVTIKRS